MFHFSVHRSFPLRQSGEDYRSVPLLPVIALPLLFGIAVGSVIGLFSDAQVELLSIAGLYSTDLGVSSFPHLIWHVFRYHLLATILATGLLGVILLPALSALRAFSLACSVAAIIQANGVHAVPVAFVSLGVPALLGLPGFLLTATDAFLISRRFVFREQRAIRSEIPLARHLLWIILLGTAELLYLRFALPALLALFA